MGMGDRPVHPDDIRGPIKIVCNHCGAKNPVKAFCCITCFKVLRPKSKNPLGALNMGAGVKILIAIAVVALFVVIAVKSWIGKIEDRTQSDLRATEQGPVEPVQPVDPALSDPAPVQPADAAAVAPVAPPASPPAN